MRKQRSRLLAAPLVEWIAEAGTQRVTRRLEPDPFVVRRASPPARSGMQRSPQFAQHRDAPLLAWSQRGLEAAPEVLDLRGFRRPSRCSLSAKHLLDILSSSYELRGHGFDDRVLRCR